MDITALLGSTPKLSFQASVSTESADAPTFAQNLSQASDRQAAEASPASVAGGKNAVSTVAEQQAPEKQTTDAAPAPAQTMVQDASQDSSQASLSTSEVPLNGAPGTEETGLQTDAQPLPTELPSILPSDVAEPPQLAAQPAAQPKPAIKPAEQPEAEEEPEEIEPTDSSTEALTSGDELDAASDSDTQLQQIRDRMHLIDNAGNPDISSVTPSYVAIASALPVTVEAPSQASETQSPQVAAPVGQYISALIKDKSDTDTQTSVESDITPLQTQLPQAVQVSDDIAINSTKTDTPDLAPPADNAAVNWNPTPLTLTSDISSNVTNSPAITATVGSAQWQTDLSQQVLGLHQRGKQQVELQLHPADLGPLSISLKMDDNGTQAQFISAHASVRSAVEQAIPHLREALAAQGISLGQTSVSDQSSRQARDDQAAGQFSSSGQSSREASDQSQDSRDSEPEMEPDLSPLPGRVDVYT